MDNILISGYYGFSNSGDDALLLSIIQELKKNKENINICVLSANAKETSEIYGVNAISRINPFHIIKKFKQTDLLILGGGTLIQDCTSTKSLLYYLGIILLAKLLKTKVMLYANGIDPLVHKFNIKFTRYVLNKVDLITLRDTSSLNVLNSLSVNKPEISVTADPAFTLSPANDNRGIQLLNKFGVPVGKKILCISVRPWVKLVYGFDTILADVIDYAADKYDLYPVFLPMQISKDLLISKKISDKLKTKSSIIDERLNSSDMLSLIGQAHMSIGMRLHTLIYSASQIVPCIGLIYNPKVEAFMGEINQSLYENVETLTAEGLKEKIDICMNDYNSICTNLSKATLELREKSKLNAKYAISLLERDVKQ